MKKNLGLLSALMLLFFAQSNAQISTFSYTGAAQTWTVPVGVCQVKVEMKGGDGGSSTSGSIGGLGGSVVCTLAVTPGQVYYLNVGGAGQDGFSGGGGGTSGPFPSGGSSFGLFNNGGGGGGGTDMRLGSNILINRIIAAGGGGGAGDGFCGLEDGGVGGGAAAAGNGADCGGYNPTTCGEGATPTAVGAGSFGGGAAGVGETGGDGAFSIATDGGGGGGGYFGGGGGGQFSSTSSSSTGGGGGGGGSSFADPGLTSVVVHSSGGATTDGSIKITVIASMPTAGTIVGSTNGCVGTTVTYTNPTATSGGTWSSTSTGTFTVNPTTGAVAMIAAGSGDLVYTITNACGTATTSLNITVSATPDPITGTLSICEHGFDNLYTTSSGGFWSSSNTTVALIDALSGFYSALTPGTSTISYTIGGCSSTAVLTVNPNPPAIVGSSAVCAGSSVTLTNSVPGGTWTSNVPTGVGVGSATGVATGIVIGAAASIYYTLPTGCYVTHFISVNIGPAPITGLNVTCEGTAVALGETVLGGTWSSGSPTIATVSSSGIVTGLMGGTSLIAYTIPGCTPETYPVTINPNPAAITGTTTICTGRPTTLSSATSGGTWTSSNPSIVVTPTTGIVTSSVIGATGTIYYTLPTSCYVSIGVNVNLGAWPIVGPTSICSGSDSVFTTADSLGLWTSTDLSIAQVIDTSGVVTGISAGAVNISYTLPNGCFAVQPLVVNPRIAGVVSISRFPSGIICEDDTVLITATPVAGGGSAPLYTWKKFSVTIPGETNDTFVYVARRPTGLHGDVINVFMFPTDGCPMYDSVADSIFMDVAPKNVHPAITISTTGPDTVSFLGETVTFYSSVTWGGTSPVYQWFKNGVAIPGANGATYTTTIYGRDTFHCEVLGNPPCMDDVLPIGLGISNRIIIYNSLEVNTLPEGDNSLSLFPNPNTGSFTLKGKLGIISNNDVTYQVTNMLGQVVHSGSTSPKNGEINAQVKLNNIPAGTYLLQVNTDKGTETFHFIVGSK